METFDETEQSLRDNLSKCRCCFRMLIDDRKAFKITDAIQQQFSELTSLELLIADVFANRICQLCASDLDAFALLRKDLIQKQKALYLLAGLHDESIYVTDPYKETNDEEENTVIRTDNDSAIVSIEAAEEFNSIEDESSHSLDTIAATEPIGEEYYESESQEAEQNTEESLRKIDKIEDQSECEDEQTHFSVIETLEEYEQYFIVNENESESSIKTEIEHSGLLVEIEEIQDENRDRTRCEHCGIEVFTKNLYNHISAVHKPFSCDLCQRAFISKSSLSRHLLEQHQNISISSRKSRRYYCDMCEKSYDYQKQLDDHIRSFHQKERDSQCNVCGKYFYHRDLRKHVLHVHGSKTIECSFCMKKFTCHENLKLHMRYHAAPEFHCKHCKKSFHQKILYDHHMLKHSNVKDHVCSKCDSAFFSRRDLKRHFQRVHEKVTRKCFGCETVFSRKDKYREHVIKQHKELTPEERDTMLNEIKVMKWNES